MTTNQPWQAYINLSREELLSRLQVLLKPKRYQHVLRVEQTAVELAKRYHYEDEAAVRIAALMHDHCKDMDAQTMAELACAYQADEAVRTAGPTIWHGLAAAQYGKAHYNIENQAILDAISQHTVGAPQMGQLSQLIFIADYIEPGRDFEGVDKARKLAKKSLKDAAFFKMKQTIEYLAHEGHPIYEGSITAYNAWATNN